jgi:diguanylate cyclase (GGDEF)-like protein
MKIHPLIGAEILEEVQFPYPVVPVVRAHHEKWDGSGYPSGLKGEEIPIGARILTVVDCFDALTSHRQYRRATSVEDAIAYLREQSGKSFDPRVVSILVEKHQELEKKVQALPLRNTRLSKNVRITRGAAPATGLDSGGAGERTASRDFLSSIAAARQEAQGLLELTHELGSSLSLDETLSVVSVRLKRMCPHDCIAIYVVRENVLVPEYVNGENFQLFSSLRIPMGEGLSGWVAQNRSPIVNGSPSVEPGYLDDPSRFSPLRSALSVPLEGLNGVAGVLSLYAAAGDAFSQDHLRILSAVTTKIALSVENALKYRQAESSAITDVLTGLPNARSLFLHLDGELARAKREGTALSVLVCDLDGFKQINDHFGHLHGNRVLRRVAEVLRENCRGYDYVARMGGDEFVLVLPGQPGDILGAKTSLLADAVRRAGQDATGTTALSLSIGAASYPADGAGAEQLLDEADRRMYKAKQAGKLAAGQPSSMEDLARFRDSLAGASQSGPSESPATPGPARAASAPGPASGFIP